mmetsp:Transcript_93509/g.286154  ORF Transcript_93509/g.286154 Transcript_93509/m.286154 type:complete len:278 (-) Transcript_93509:1302-2135(-)
MRRCEGADGARVVAAGSFGHADVHLHVPPDGGLHRLRAQQYHLGLLQDSQRLNRTPQHAQRPPDARQQLGAILCADGTLLFEHAPRLLQHLQHALLVGQRLLARGEDPQHPDARGRLQRAAASGNRPGVLIRRDHALDIALGPPRQADVDQQPRAVRAVEVAGRLMNLPRAAVFLQSATVFPEQMLQHADPRDEVGSARILEKAERVALPPGGLVRLHRAFQVAQIPPHEPQLHQQPEALLAAQRAQALVPPDDGHQRPTGAHEVAAVQKRDGGAGQ